MTNRNQYQKARAVLQSLIQGLDPETGVELPKDAIVNRIEVNRSMLVAVTAMEQVQARILRRAMLPEGVGKTWTDEEVQRLKVEFAKYAASDAMPIAGAVNWRWQGNTQHRSEFLISSLAA